MGKQKHQRHAHYLQAMGIDIWQRRSQLPGQASQAHAQTQAELNQQSTSLVAAQAPPSSPAPSAPEPEPEPLILGADTGADTMMPPLDERSARIAAMDWQALRQAVLDCQACKLHESRTQGVFGVGNQTADWMIIGEAPGADEDRLGEPFVGRAGKLLDLMLPALGLQREQVFIANVLKSRPPNNRDPAPDEVRACWPYLERQVELVQPKIILVMGRIAAQNLLQTTTPVGKLRGQVHRFGKAEIPLIVTYHPAYLLRSPREKRKSWADLQLAQQTMQQLAQEQAAC